jgi:hypothetical protein
MSCAGKGARGQAGKVESYEALDDCAPFRRGTMPGWVQVAGHSPVNARCSAWALNHPPEARRFRCTQLS